MNRIESEKAERPFIVFGSPKIDDEEIAEVVDCLKSGWLGTGPKVERFERDFGNYKGSSYAVSVSSCTAALHLSLIAADLPPDCEVLTTALTFGATINAIIHAGGSPVLVDINPETHNIDSELIESKINSKTKAILPVHFAGYPCDMENIVEIADRYDLKIIEDCAHAIESEINGRKVGTFGEFGCFSFYVTKNLVTGEGGMIITENEEAAKRIKRLALHGLSSDAWKRFSDDGYKHYMIQEAGFKYNMTDIQAAMGIHQLKKIEIHWQRRKEIWNRYQSEFRDLKITLPAEPENGVRHAYHLYTILIDEQISGMKRDDFLSAMTANRIGVGVHYISIPEHPYYRERFNWNPKDYPISYRVGRQIVSLPLSAKLSDDDVDYIIKIVRKLVRKR